VELSEPELVAAASDGDLVAFAELVRRNHVRVLGFCRSMLGDATSAEDAAQEVFLKAFRSIEKFRGGSAFYTWLHRIAVRHCLDLLRGEARRKTRSWDALLEDEGDRVQALLSQPDSSRSLEDRDLAARLLAVLPPDYRTVLILREMEGQTYEEIADTMGCTVDSVKARLQRARRDLTERLRHFLAPKNVKE
jgi:RNA polymerase sigma-70 factor (ECF subfamily)